MLRSKALVLTLATGIAFASSARAELFGWISAPPELNVCEMPAGTLVFPMRSATFMANSQQAPAGEFIEISTTVKTAYRRGVPAGAMFTLGAGENGNRCLYSIEKVHPKIPNLGHFRFTNGYLQVGGNHGEFIVKIWAPLAVDDDLDFVGDGEDRCIANPNGRGVHLYGPRIGCADGQTVNH